MIEHIFTSIGFSLGFCLIMFFVEVFIMEEIGERFERWDNILMRFVKVKNYDDKINESTKKLKFRFQVYFFGSLIVFLFFWHPW